MSSRLLQMKFMQRAAASTQSQPSSPRTPGSASGHHTPATPDIDSDRPSKRPRLSTDNNADGSPLSRQQSNASFVSDEDERRREEALERAGRERGETRWTLSLPGAGGAASPTAAPAAAAATSQRFVEVGRDEIEDVAWAAGRDGKVAGRLSFGRKHTVDQMVAEAQQTPVKGEEDDEDDGEDDDEYDPADVDVDGLVDGAAERAREDRKRKKSAERARSVDLARERRRKEVRLNTGGGGISSGGNTPNGRRSYGGGGGGKKRSSLGKDGGYRH